MKLWGYYFDKDGYKCFGEITSAEDDVMSIYRNLDLDYSGDTGMEVESELELVDPSEDPIITPGQNKLIFEL